MRESRPLQRESFHAQVVDAVEQPVRAGLQHALEVAIAQQQATLVLLLTDTLDLHVVLLVGLPVDVARKTPAASAPRASKRHLRGPWGTLAWGGPAPA